MRDIRNEYLSNAFRDISFYGTLQQYNLEDKHNFLRYERALKDIQLYGSPEEIILAEELFTISDTSVKIDTFIKLLRDDLRKEYNLEEIKGEVFWVMNEKLFKDISSKP